MLILPGLCLASADQIAGQIAGAALALLVHIQDGASTSLVPAVLAAGGALALGYAGLSLVIARRLAFEVHMPVDETPEKYGLAYEPVRFPAREDGTQLDGWLVPGVRASGCLSLSDVVVMVHGARQNRTDPAVGLLELTAALARRGIAVLAFDLRGHGNSEAAPLSFGYYERRDVLGAVDFLCTGELPYPELGRPEWIGGWGVSLGADALLLAARDEARLRALVADSAYPAIAPIVRREIPKASGLPAVFTSGALLAARLLYGMNIPAVRVRDVVASIAPRPILFIHGAQDDFNPPANLSILVAAASREPNAQVSSWLVPDAPHAQAFHTDGAAYVSLVEAFFASSARKTRAIVNA